MRIVAFLNSNYVNDLSSADATFNFNSCIDVRSYKTDINRQVDADDKPINKTACGKITVEFMVGPDTGLYKPLYESLAKQEPDSFSLFFNLEDEDETKAQAQNTTVGSCSCSGSIVFDGYIISINEEYKQDESITEKDTLDLFMTVEILATNIVYIAADSKNDVIYQFSN